MTSDGMDKGLFEDIFDVCRGGKYRSQREVHRAIFNVELNGTEEQISCVVGSVGVIARNHEILDILNGVKDWFATEKFLEKRLSVSTSF